MSFFSVINAAKLYVDDDRVQCPDAAYKKIQSAVNNANVGDEIIICDGTYNESIQITNNKNNLILRSQSGNPADVIINSKNKDHAFYVYNSSSVKFHDLTINGQGCAILYFNSPGAFELTGSILSSQNDHTVYVGGASNNINIADNKFVKAGNDYKCALQFAGNINTGSIINNNISTNNDSGYGILLEQMPSNLTVTNNCFTNIPTLEAYSMATWYNPIAWNGNYWEHKSWGGVKDNNPLSSCQNMAKDTLPKCDDFNSSLDGWSGSGVSLNNNRMKIDRDKTASKTYNFSSSSANKDIEISLNYETTGGWDDSGNHQDYIKISANGSSFPSISVPDGEYSSALEASLDTDGKLSLSINVDTTGNGEIAYFDQICVKEAIVPVVPKLCSTIKGVGNSDDGVYLASKSMADEISMLPFEVGCSGMGTSSPSEYIPLKSTGDKSYSNFRFNSSPRIRINHTNYYNYYIKDDDIRDFFDALPVNVKDGSLEVADSFLSNGFSNINLIGTSFKIDMINSDFGHCDITTGYNDQVIKVTNIGNNYYVCKPTKIVLTQIGNYYFPDIYGGATTSFKWPDGEPYTSCAAIYQASGGVQDGYYYVNPKAKEDKAIVAYCKNYEKDDRQQYERTMLMALDAPAVKNKQDVGRIDMCYQYGLDFFVPVDKETFEDIQAFVVLLKDEWKNYTGTVNEMIQAFRGPTYTYYISDYGNNLFWPYGPFGLYNPQSGISSNINGTVYNVLNSSDPRSLAKNPRSPWVTVFGSADLDIADTWWISDKDCSQGGYDEPNGNYNANQWLNFIADNNGNIVHCDDSNNEVTEGYEGEYVYPHYMCMTTDSYSDLNAKPIYSKIWRIKDPSDSARANMYTQVEGGDGGMVHVAFFDDNESLNPAAFDGNITVYLVKDGTTKELVGRFDDISVDIGDPYYPIALNSAVLVDAVKSAQIEVVLTNALGETNSTSDTFSIRPKTYIITSSYSKSAKAGEAFVMQHGLDITINAVDYSNALSMEYNATDIDKNITSKINAPVGGSCVVLKPDIDATFINPDDGNFSGGILQNDLNLSVLDVGELNVTIQVTDNNWTNVDRPDECVENSSSYERDANGKVGCNIEGNATFALTVMPYRLDVNITGITNEGDDAFMYYGQNFLGNGNDGNISYEILTKNKDGDITKNYDKDCFAPEDANVTLNIDMINNGKLPIVFRRGDTDAVLLNGLELAEFDINITEKNTTFNDGNSSGVLPYSINVDRAFENNRIEPKNPLVINGTDANVSILSKLAASSDINGSKDNVSFDIDVTYYFARLVPIDTKTTGGTATVSFYIDVYCNESDCTQYGLDENNKSLVYPVDWYRIEDDYSISGLSFIIPPNADVVKGAVNGNKVAFTKTDPNFFGRVRVDIDHKHADNNNTYLYYNPYSNNNITRFYIDFLKPEGDEDTEGVIQNQGRNTAGGKRLDW